MYLTPFLKSNLTYFLTMIGNVNKFQISEMTEKETNTYSVLLRSETKKTHL